MPVACDRDEPSDEGDDRDDGEHDVEPEGHAVLVAPRQHERRQSCACGGREVKKKITQPFLNTSKSFRVSKYNNKSG